MSNYTRPDFHQAINVDRFKDGSSLKASNQAIFSYTPPGATESADIASSTTGKQQLALSHASCLIKRAKSLFRALIPRRPVDATPYNVEADYLAIR